MGTADKNNFDRVYWTDGERVDKPDAEAWQELIWGIIRRNMQTIFSPLSGTFVGGLLSGFTASWSDPDMTFSSGLVIDPNYEAFFYEGGSINVPPAMRVANTYIWGKLESVTADIQNRVIHDGTSETIQSVPTRYNRSLILTVATTQPTSDWFPIVQIQDWTMMTMEYFYIFDFNQSTLSIPESVWGMINEIEYILREIKGTSSFDTELQPSQKILGNEGIDNRVTVLENNLKNNVKASGLIFNNGSISHSTENFTVSYDDTYKSYTILLNNPIYESEAHGVPMVTVQGLLPGSIHNLIPNVHVQQDPNGNWTGAIVTIVDPTTGQAVGSSTAFAFYFIFI